MFKKYKFGHEDGVAGLNVCENWCGTDEDIVEIIAALILKPFGKYVW